jgi:hypothetical protein
MAALSLLLAELLKFEFTSTKTVAQMGSIASPHPASVLNTFSRETINYTFEIYCLQISISE